MTPSHGCQECPRGAGVLGCTTTTQEITATPAGHSRLRLAAAALLAAGGLSAGLAQPGAAHAATCANQNTPLGTTAAAEDGIVCLTNQVRAAAGLPRVFVSTRLASIAV